MIKYFFQSFNDKIIVLKINANLNWLYNYRKSKKIGNGSVLYKNMTSMKNNKNQWTITRYIKRRIYVMLKYFLT